MTTVHSILLMALIAILTSCGTKISQPGPNVDNTNNGAPSVETKAPNTNYPPAFKGQTRIAAVSTKAPYKAEVLDNSLNKPWGITVLPDGRFLITEKKGNNADRLIIRDHE